jgi:CHAT domain-containing protein/tetratricopeptide (TPR) repeat protein
LDKSILEKDMAKQVLILSYIAELYNEIRNIDSCTKYTKLSTYYLESCLITDSIINFEVNNSLMNAYYYLANYPKTIPYGKTALNYINPKYTNHPEFERLRIYEIISNSFLLMEEFDSVLKYVDKSESILSVLMNPSTNYLLSNIWKKASVLMANGLLDEALNEFLKSESLIDNHNPTYIASTIYTEIGNIYYSLRELDKSIQYYEQALRIYQRLNLPKHPYYTSAYTDIARVYLLLNKNEEALSYLKQIIQVISENNNPYIMHIYQNISAVYMQMDSLEQANDYLKKSIVVLNKYYNKEVSITYAKAIFYYGHFLIERLYNPEGVKLTNQAIKILRGQLGEKHPDLADCYQYIGLAKKLIDNDVDSALFYYQKALITNDLTFNETSFFQNPKVENAISKKILLNILRNKIDALTTKIWKTKNLHDQIAYTELMNSTLLLAIETVGNIRNSFTSIDSKLKMNEKSEYFLSKLIASSFTLHKLTNNNKYLYDAYVYAEKSKLATLNELINENGAKISGGVPPELITEEKKLRIRKGELENDLYNDEISNNADQNRKEILSNQLFIIDQKIDILTSKLENQYKNYYKLKYQNRQLDIESIQKIIADEQAVIEYFLTDTTIYEFVITKNDFQVFEKIIDSTFINNIYTITEISKNNTFTHFDVKQFYTFKEKSFQLYQILIAPLDAIIKDKELIIIPDKELLQLPFEVLLMDQDLSISNYRSLSYLIKYHPISYSYSTEWLFEQRIGNKAKNNLLAILPSYDQSIDYESFIPHENKNYERDLLLPIPAAIEEVKNISKSIEGEILEAENATELNFKNIAADYSILHFAMHTIIDNNNPMFSKLVFTPQTDDSTNKEDNLLNTYEIFNLNLNAQMVVLSSCNTGNGNLQKGEGIMSMARGFMYAGCKSLGITLWSVDDNSSADLMSYFYEFLANGMTKSMALQSAKIKYLQLADPISTHPHFWASYILIGDTTQLELRTNNLFKYLLIGIFIPVFFLLFRKIIIGVLK